MNKPSAIGADITTTVYIDPDLKDIVPGFLENRRGDLKKLEIARQQRDFNTVHVLGHRMKGDGGGYGFDAIGAIGEALEQAALRQDWAVIERQTTELGDFLAHVTVVYRR